MRSAGGNLFYSASSTRSLMLELQTKTASRWAVSYAYLLAVHHDPTGSIDLHFSFGKVEIEGSNLMDLYEGLAHQNIATIREADPDKDVIGPGRVLIQTITISLDT